MNPLSNNDKRNLEPENSTLNNNEALNKKQNLGLHPPLNNVLNSLPNMPKLVKCMIFRELEDMQDVFSLALACKSLSLIYQDNSIWKGFHDRIFPERKDVELNGYYAICKEQQNLINKINNKNYWIESKLYNQEDAWQDRKPSHWNLKGTNLVIDSYQKNICKFLDLKTGEKFSVDTRDCHMRFVRNLMFLIDKKKGVEIWDLNKKTKCTLPEIDSFNWHFSGEIRNITHLRNNIPLNGKISLKSLSNNFHLLYRSLKKNDNKIYFFCLDIIQGKGVSNWTIEADIINPNCEFSYEINVEIDENDFLNIRKCETNKKTLLTKNSIVLRDLKTNKFIYQIKNLELADVNKFIGCETSIKTNFIFALLNDKSIPVRDIENKPICHLKDVEFNLEDNKINKKFIYEHLLLAPKASDKCTLAVWDLAAKKQIGCLVHYDGQNQPSEIMQIEKMGNSLVTISKKTIQVWDVMSQNCFHVGNLNNEEPYRTKLVFGNYLVDSDRRNLTLSSWNIKTKTHSKFHRVRPDLLEGGQRDFFMQTKGNLLAVYAPRENPTSTVVFFNLENNCKSEHRLIEKSCTYQMNWLENGTLVLRPSGNIKQENPNCQIFKF